MTDKKELRSLYNYYKNTEKGFVTRVINLNPKYRPSDIVILKNLFAVCNPAPPILII